MGTLAIINHTIRDLGLRTSAIASFAETFWSFCVEHDCTALMSKRLCISMIQPEVELLAGGEPPRNLEGLVIPSLPTALAALEDHLTSAARRG